MEKENGNGKSLYAGHRVEKGQVSKKLAIISCILKGDFDLFSIFPIKIKKT